MQIATPHPSNSYIFCWLVLFSPSTSWFSSCCCSPASSATIAVGCSNKAVNGMCRYSKSSLQLGGGASGNIPCTGPPPIGWTWTVQGMESGEAETGVVPELVETGPAGTVPVPVAAMMEGSAWRRSHSMVSPSERWPSSRVNWKIRAAQRAGIRTRLPLPLTLVWRSLELDMEDFRANWVVVLGWEPVAGGGVDSESMVWLGVRVDDSRERI